MQNKLEFFLLKLLSSIISKFNLTNARKLAKMLAFLFCTFIPLRKNIVVKNLKIAFPEISKNELRKLVKAAYQNLFIVLVEILYLPFLNKEEIEQLVEIQNVELVENELKKNKGLIFLSAHFGNWEIVAISSALRLKKNFVIVTKPLRNDYVDSYINEWRCKFGNSIIPVNRSIKSVFKALLDKQIVALLADQRASTNSLELKFFDRLTYVYEGPATFSVKTGAPLLLGMAIRQRDFKYKVELTPIPVPGSCDDSQKIKMMTENYIHLLENYIKKYPDHWLWFHNRWRH